MSNRVFDIQGALNILTNNAQTVLSNVQSQAARTSVSFGGLERSAEGLNRTFAGMQGPTKWALQFTGVQSAIRAVQGAVVGAISTTVNFEAGMRNLNTILKLSESELGVYSEKLRTLGKDLKLNVSATETVGAAYDVAQAGFTNAADNMNVMTAALRASAASGTKAEKTANLLSGTLKAYNLQADQAGRVSDIYFKVVENGIITFDQLAQSVGSVNSVAAQAGVPIEEIGAVLATVTNRGIRSHVAMAGLRQILSHLIATTGPARKELDKYGLTVNENTLRQKGLIQTLMEIRKATGGNAESLRVILGDVNAFSVALAATSQSGKNVAKDLVDMTKSFEGFGATQAAINEQSKSLRFAWGEMKVGMEALGINIFQNFNKPVATAVRYVTGWINSIDDLMTHFTKLGKGNMMDGILTAISQKFPATHTMLVQLGKTLKELGEQWLRALLYFSDPSAGDAMTSWIDAVGYGIVGLTNWIVNFIGVLGEIVGAIVKGMEVTAVAFGAISATIGPVLSKYKTLFADMFDYIVDYGITKFQNLVDFMIKKLDDLPIALKKLVGVEDTKATLNKWKVESEESRPTDVKTGGQLAKQAVDIADHMGNSLKDAFNDYDKQVKKRNANTKATITRLNTPNPPVKNPPQEGFASGGGAVDPPPAMGDLIETRAEALKHEISLEKISKAEGVRKYQELLKLAKEAKIKADDIYKIEKGLFDLRKDMAKEEEKRQETRNKLHVEWLKNTKGETAADTAKLGFEREEKLKEGVPEEEVNKWVASEKDRIAKEDEERRKKEKAKKMEALQDQIKLDAKILEAEDKVLQAKLKNLDAEKLKHLQDTNDKLKTEKWYQAERLKLIKQGNMQRLKMESDNQQKILQNLADAETDPAKKAALEHRASNVGQLQAIRERIAEMKAAGATDVEVARYVASEKKRILMQSKKDAQDIENGPDQNSPVMSMEEAFSGGFNFKTTSINSSSKSRASRKQAKLDKELANSVGNLANEDLTKLDPKQTEQMSQMPDDVYEQVYGEKKPPTPVNIGVTPAGAAVDESAGAKVITTTKDEKGQTVISNRRKQGSKTSKVIEASGLATSALGIKYGPDGEVKSSDPVAAKGAAKLAAAKGVSPGEKDMKDAVTAIESILTIRFQDDSGSTVRTETVKGSGDKKTEAQIAFDYTPGRFV